MFVWFYVCMLIIIFLQVIVINLYFLRPKMQQASTSSPSSSSDFEIFFEKKYILNLSGEVSRCSVRVSSLISYNMKSGNPHFTDWQKTFQLHKALTSFLDEMKLVPNYHSLKIYKKARIDQIRAYRRLSLHRLVDRKFSAKGRGTSVKDRNKQYRICEKVAKQQEVAEFLYCIQKVKAGHLLVADVVAILANALGNNDWINVKEDDYDLAGYFY
jgi:hypothetical protein